MTTRTQYDNYLIKQGFVVGSILLAASVMYRSLPYSRKAPSPDTLSAPAQAYIRVHEQPSTTHDVRNRLDDIVSDVQTIQQHDMPMPELYFTLLNSELDTYAKEVQEHEKTVRQSRNTSYVFGIGAGLFLGVGFGMRCVTGQREHDNE